jgi:DNA-binding NarL/FixJ family response regulator
MSLEQAIAVALAIPAAPAAVPTGTQPAPTLPTRKTHPAGLSAREVEVLRLIADGLTDAQVAEKLVLSPRTVNAHLQSIYNKIGVNSRIAATRFAVDNGLV